MTPREKSRGRPATDAIVLADRYRLEEQIATGGMGEVWRATDLLLERTVAVKLLRESLAEDPIVAERFRREALTAARLTHPNMADVYDYVQADGRPGIVMEYVDGETLATMIARDGALDVGEAVRIVSALLAVLQAAHDAGVVHRDVKPGNVIVTPAGEVKVTDFGIARATGHETLTETGMVVGTAHYLSPEQVSGQPATPASDIYAAGAILYEMVTGARPFEADTPLAVAMRRLSEDPTPPGERRADLPVPVGEVVLRSMARDPARRYHSAEAMRVALQAALRHASASAAAPRSNPTPTEVLPLGDQPDAPTLRFERTPPAEPAALTGISPAAAVAERRRRDYRKGILWLLLLALGVGIVTVLLLFAFGGTQTAEVPDFSGMTITQAKAFAADLGIEVTEEPKASGEPKGRVLGQSLQQGIEVARGTSITLFVSTGVAPPPPCCRVPNLDGLTEQEAKDALEAANLKLGKVLEEESNEPKGIVFGQEPDAGQTLDPDTEVDIVVSKGDGKGKGNGRGNSD